MMWLPGQVLPPQVKVREQTVPELAPSLALVAGPPSPVPGHLNPPKLASPAIKVVDVPPARGRRSTVN